MKHLSSTFLLAFFTFCAVNTYANEIPKAPDVVQQTVPADNIAVVNKANIVNINTASAEEIQDKLIGIGTKKAQAIVEYRAKVGKFTHIEQLTEQLTEVSGIGKATLDKNRDRIILE